MGKSACYVRVCRCAAYYVYASSGRAVQSACYFTFFGGDEGDRTPYPLLARQVLSQMSYTPTVLEDNEVITLYPLSSLRNKPQKLNNDNTSALNIG